MKKFIIKTNTQKPKPDIDKEKAIDKWIGVKPKRQQLNINIPDYLHSILKSKAAVNKTNMTNVVLEAIKQYCEEK